MRKMKNSGIEWIGQIPEEWNIWPTKRFFRHTKTLAGEQVDSYERLALTMNGVIKRSKDDSEGLQPEKFDTYQVLRENELVFKLIDLANVKTSRVGLSPYTGIVSPAYIILTNDNEDNRFYYYYFMSLYYNEIFNNLGDNGVRSSLNAQDLLNIPIVDIPSSLQKRIADYLDEKCGKIDRYIEKQQKIIDKLKEYKQAVITEAVTKGLDPDAPMKDSGIEWIGMIPEHWKVMRIKNLLKERNERSEDGIEEPLSMSQKLGLIPTKFMDTIPNIASSFIGAKLAYVNDLVFNKLKAHLGVFSVSHYDGLVSPDYAVYYSTGLANLKYLEYTFKTPQCICEFRKKSSGIADGLTRLYTSGLFSIYVPFPCIMEQNCIAKHLETKCSEIDSAISKQTSIIEKLTEYKKSLIYEAVTGKLEV